MHFKRTHDDAMLVHYGEISAVAPLPIYMTFLRAFKFAYHICNIVAIIECQSTHLFSNLSCNFSLFKAKASAPTRR